MDDLLYPIKNFRIVDRDLLRANDYNPNTVSDENMKLLTKSIMSNGFTSPIVCRRDFTIIDGFHRWTCAGREPLRTLLGGKVPIVIVEHETRGDDQIATIAFNRARGTHGLHAMKRIIKELFDEGRTTKEICKQLGMRPEEVFRLSEFSRDDFLALMIDGSNGYNKAFEVTDR